MAIELPNQNTLQQLQQATTLENQTPIARANLTNTNQIDIVNATADKADVERFETLLLNTHRSGIEDLVEWIRNSDFYIAPASTRYHMSLPGGLLKHSLNVFMCLSHKTKSPIWGPILGKYGFDTLIIVSLLHDLCKANFYAVDFKKQKINGEWKTVPYYTVKDQLPLGHGEKSALIVMDFIKLSNDEKLAIRWHMGFSDATTNIGTASQAMSKVPLVLALSESDMEATFILEADKEDK